MEWCAWLCVLLLSLLAAASNASEAELLDYEPVQYLKGHVSAPASAVWGKLLESSPEEAKETVLAMKHRLDGELRGSGVSLVFAKGDRLLIKRLSGGVKWASSIEVPFAGVVPLIGATLPILLENYKHSVVADPIVSVLKGEHASGPLVKRYEQQSLLELLNTLPAGTATSLKEMDAIGRGAHYFVSTVLDKYAKEAWLDALLSVGLDESTFDGTLKTSFNDLIQYILMLSHDFEMLDRAPKEDLLPLHSEHYLFGWWVNCVKSSCLIPEAPPGTIFSISRSVRMYLSPSLDLSLLVLAERSSAKTVADVLQEDRNVWQQLHSAINEDPATHSQANDDHESKQNRDKKDNSESSSSQQSDEKTVDDGGREMLIQLIHGVWPVSVFLFWIISSHVWVYWVLHAVWTVATTLYPRTHKPRPKTAKGD